MRKSLIQWSIWAEGRSYLSEEIPLSAKWCSMKWLSVQVILSSLRKTIPGYSMSSIKLNMLMVSVMSYVMRKVSKRSTLRISRKLRFSHSIHAISTAVQLWIWSCWQWRMNACFYRHLPRSPCRLSFLQVMEKPCISWPKKRKTRMREKPFFMRLQWVFILIPYAKLWQFLMKAILITTLNLITIIP